MGDVAQLCVTARTFARSGQDGKERPFRGSKGYMILQSIVDNFAHTPNLSGKGRRTMMEAFLVLGTCIVPYELPQSMR